MNVEEEKQLSFVLNETRTQTINLQTSIKGEVLAAVSAEDKHEIKPSESEENQSKGQSQQVIAPDGSIVSEDAKSAEGEKASEEKKTTEEEKPAEQQGTQGAQGSDDTSVLAVTSENPADLREGHSENLMYVWYGLPPDVDSTPRRFDIGPFPPAEQKLYLPTIEPAEQVVAPAEGPCCVFDVPIFIEVFEIPGFTYTDQDGTVQNGDLTINDHTYTFTFEGFCDDLTPSDLIFTETFNGSTSTLTIPIESCSDSGSSGCDCSSGDGEVPIGIEGGEFYEGLCCPEVNCDNPISSIVINAYSSGILYTTGIDLFVDYATYDSYGNPYFFVDNNGQITLESICCLENQIAPIVLDLNNNGFDLTNAKNSNVLLTVDDNSVKTGWIGPTDGLLTYNYSGQGAIENKNFILTENVPGAKTDLQALESLAGQQGGIIDNSTAIWEKLGVWQDANQDGKMGNGEYHTLSELGIKSIDLNGTETAAKNQNGNIVNSIISFTYNDGTVGKGADVALKFEDVIQSNNNVPGLGSPASNVAPPSVSEASVAPVAHDAAVQSAVEAVVQQQPIAQAA